MKYMMEAYGGPSLSKKKEVSPSLQAGDHSCIERTPTPSL